MKIRVEIDNEEFKAMLKQRLREKISDLVLDDNSIHIEVKSKQNYRDTQWENGDVRCWIEVNSFMQRGL